MRNLVSLFFIMLGLQLCGELSFSFAQSEPLGFRAIEAESRDEFSNETPSYNYERFDEVEKKCKFVLSSASELSSDSTRFLRMKEQLQFVNGDWRQDAGKYPIMPFNDENYVSSKKRYYMDHVNGSKNVETPLKLISFWVMDIDPAHQSKKSVSVSGLLSMGIALDGTFEQWYSEQPHFHFWSGSSELLLPFQGIYTESKKNGGERVLCLLGSGLLPSRDQESDDPWSWAKDSDVNRHQMPLLQDDQILLVLRFPMKFTLTSRVIQGDLRSLNPKSNPKYFDDIHISSQLRDVHYEFVSEKSVKKACAPYPYNDGFVKKNISVYRGSSFCRVLQEITREQAFTVLPNWRCNSTDDFCRKLGPFVSDKEINRTDGSFKDVKIYMQDVTCKIQGSNKKDISASVSAVFRAVSPSENLYTAWRRSVLNNMTMVSEGMWKSSSGQLCMVGCLGLVNGEKISCDSRICLYIPISFTLKQRSILVGSITSVTDKPTYFPLSFEKLFQPMESWSPFRDSHPFYSYTKIALAGALLERNEAFSFRSVIKKSLLRYPKLEDTESYELSKSLLSEDLTLHVPALVNPAAVSQTSRIDVQLDIISVGGSFFGRYLSGINGSISDVETPYHSKPEYTEKQLLLNVSTQLSLPDQMYSNFSALFLEGIYDPHVGHMYLVGCRDVRASWKVLFDSMDLEDGLDCQIEVIVSYPPSTAQWLVNPTAKISISSRRTEDDPLYFRPIKLETMPIMYRRQRQDILSRKSVEGVLRILTLSLAIACISSQIFYINHNLESVPFISLLTLGIQSLGFTLPLVTGAEAVFKQRGGSESYKYSSNDLEDNLWFLVIDYIVKLLVVISLLLTLRLCQKVWRSRIKLLRQAPLEPHRVPSDKWVLIATLFIHLIGYVAVIVVRTSRTAETQVTSDMVPSLSSSSHMTQGWERDLQEYVGLVQDFFLLPQIIGNLLWQIDCKPLRKFYFIGITLVRLLPHLYDFIIAPTVNPYFVQEYDFVNPSMDFYSRFGDVFIPLIAFILAVVVYIQQRWNYEKLSQALVVGRVRLLPSASRMYQRLPSKSYEAELASVENGNTKHEDVD